MKPKGGVLIGLAADGTPVYRTPRQASTHTLIVGAPGTGKTTEMELQARQLIKRRRGLIVIDPHSDLCCRLRSYHSYRRAIGPVSELIWFEPPADWVTPFNPFAKGAGDVGVRVDRLVAATLRVWGQHSGDQTPRLEKWLRCCFTVLIEQGLTILEAPFLVDPKAGYIRQHLLKGLADPVISRKLEQLGTYKPAELLAQVESFENRLMRFLCAQAIRRTMGLGQNAVDIESIVEERKTLLAPLQPSENFSSEQGDLVGTMLLTGVVEYALQRPVGSPQFDLVVDEAHKFTIPELGDALNEGRKRGLCVTLGCQHLAQFKAVDFELYKSVKNSCRNKIAFCVPDRRDALELADDLFPNLAEAETKYLHRHLSHKIIDTREKSITRGHGSSQSWGFSEGDSEATGYTKGHSDGNSSSRTTADHRSKTRTFTRSQGKSWQRNRAQTLTDSEQESHSRGFTESSSHHHGSNSTTTTGSSSGSSKSDKTGESTQQESSHHSSTYGYSESHDHTSGSTSHDTWGRSRTRGVTKSRLAGGSTEQSVAHGRQTGITQTRGSTSSQEDSESQSETQTLSQGRSFEKSKSRSMSVTDQPGTRHIPFLEEQPEHYTLEERRWRAAEAIMTQKTGQCFVQLADEQVKAITVPKPPKFYIRPRQRLQFLQELYQKHALPATEVDRLIKERQEKLLQEARRAAQNGPNSKPRSKKTKSKKAEQKKDSKWADLADEALNDED